MGSFFIKNLGFSMLPRSARAAGLGRGGWAVSSLGAAGGGAETGGFCWAGDFLMMEGVDWRILRCELKREGLFSPPTGAR